MKVIVTIHEKDEAKKTALNNDVASICTGLGVSTAPAENGFSIAVTGADQAKSVIAALSELEHVQLQTEE